MSMAAGFDRAGRVGPVIRRPYWLLPVALAMMLLPSAATAAIVGGLLALRLGWLGRQRLASRRERDGESRPTIALGRDSGGRALRLDDRQLAAHGLILGASGTGKTTTLLTLLGQQIARGGPVVAIDMKGSPGFARQLAAAAAAAGREFRVWSLDGPASWNPLRYGNATELKDKLIASERFTEPHYQKAAERYLQAVIGVLQETHGGRGPTLAEVVEAMEPRRLALRLRAVSRPQARRVSEYLAELTLDQQSAIRGVATRLAVLSESPSGRFLQAGPDAIDLRHALRGKEVVLFSLNSSTYGHLAAQVGTLVVQDLVTVSGSRLNEGPSPPQALVAIDEFSALGSDNVIALLARGREAGMPVLLATQELADLDRAAAGLRDQVLGNSALKIIHRQDVPSSAQIVAQMAGTERVWEHTYRSGAGLLGRYDSRPATRREGERFLVHPNDIKRLRTGEAVVLSKIPQASVRTVRIEPRAGGSRDLRDRGRPDLGAAER